MRHTSKKRGFAGALIAAAVAALVAVVLVPAAATAGSTTSGLSAPTANMPTQSTIGKGEGHLNLIAWEGYVQPEWTKPFEKSTGCQVNVKYAGTSSDMVSLMANGGGGQYDLVSASGDADLRLIYGGDVRPVNISLIPSWKQFYPFLQSPAFNTIAGKHYGVSFEFGPNILLYSTKTFKTPPTSWSVIYDKKYKGQITIPDNPIQIADAALYLSKSQPKLGITDPYELTQPQFSAAVALLKSEHPLIKKYWDLASQEISLFASGTTVVGAAWPYQETTLAGQHDAVASTIPKEGATGWADTWMLATKAPDPNCAYKWMAYMSTPKIQAQDADSYGETPANTKACSIMNTIAKGSCDGYHANAPQSYFQTIKFWKTPLATCDNGKNDCVPFQQWVTAWTQIIG
ncbi:MAG TPA: ABC transporter substrate-binding protein [Solirubrobacteraceae bacterium]|jgi:putative spermidine/putrescine transport system substrate-binding protein|nr:ABC transporter substrate-binding protein [Solirubrobacteraceae bacterium]